MKYVYKIIAALGALSVIPVIIFAKTIYYKIASTAMATIFLLGQLFKIDALTDVIKENNGVAPENMADITSLYDLYNLFSKISGDSSSETLERLDVLIAPAITCAVALVLIAICAIVTAVLAIVVKNNRAVIYSSIAGIGLSMVFKESFEGLASPILDGTVNFSTLLDSTWASLIGSFTELELTTSFWFIPAIFAAVIIWTVLYNYTLPDNEKRERKLMLGEADEE